MPLKPLVLAWQHRLTSHHPAFGTASTNTQLTVVLDAVMVPGPHVVSLGDVFPEDDRGCERMGGRGTLGWLSCKQ